MITCVAQFQDFIIDGRILGGSQWVISSEALQDAEHFAWQTVTDHLLCARPRAGGGKARWTGVSPARRRAPGGVRSRGQTENVIQSHGCIPGERKEGLPSRTGTPNVMGKLWRVLNRRSWHVLMYVVVKSPWLPCREQIMEWGWCRGSIMPCWGCPGRWWWRLGTERWWRRSGLGSKPGYILEWSVQDTQSSKGRETQHDLCVGLGTEQAGSLRCGHWDGECMGGKHDSGWVFVVGWSWKWDQGFALSAWFVMNRRYLNGSPKCEAGFSRQE